MGSKKVAPDAASTDEQPKKHLKDNKEKDKPKSKSLVMWLVKVLLITIALSCCFSIITEVVYNAIVISTVKLAVASVLVLLIIFLAIVSDMIGVAVTACDIEPFHAMASRKTYGARKAVILCKNADKVASIISDIVGDVCGVISGASGMTIANVILLQCGFTDTWAIILVSAAVSAIIAAITITGKAVGKRIAINKSHDITLGLAKLMSIFDKKS